MSWRWFADDDSWFLQVAHRVSTGETLYRDVFFGVTPLSLYIASGLTRLFGTDIIVLKLAGSAVSTAVMLLCCRIARELGAKQSHPPALVLSLFVFASPGTIVFLSFYSNLANCFLLAALWLVLVWIRRRHESFLIGAGAVLALSILAKQNFGLYGCIALLLGIVAVAAMEGRTARWVISRTAIAAAPCIVVVVIGLIPVILGGALRELADYGFLGKGRYLTLGRISYVEAFREFIAVASPLSSDTLRAFRTLIPFLLPAALAPLVIMAMPRMSAERRMQAVIVMLFVVASLAGVYPRADSHHFVFAVPFLLVAIGMCVSTLLPTLWFARPLTLAGYAALGVASVMVVAEAARRFASKSSIASPFPHFRGSLIDRAEAERLAANLRMLGKLPRDGRTFIIAPNAAFYYLAGGLRNPTPYDYPFVVSFGRSGEQRTIQLIADGKIARVCIDPAVPVEMRPRALEEAGRSQMHLVPSPASCQLYVRGPVDLRDPVP